jgi:hypothetical protein
LLKEKTIVVPGIFFDVNPSHRRNLFNSPCHHFVRLSYGPPIEDLDKGLFISSESCSSRHGLIRCCALGLDAIGRVLKKAHQHGMKVFGHTYKKGLKGMDGGPRSPTGAAQA